MDDFDKLRAIAYSDPTPDEENETPTSGADQAEAMVASLGPAGFAVRHRLTAALDRIPGDRKTLVQILVHENDVSFVEATTARTLKIRSLETSTEIDFDILSGWNRTKARIDPANLAAGFRSFDLLVAVTAEPLTGASARLSEQTVDLTRLDVQDVEAALRRRFGGESHVPSEFEWPPGLPLQSFEVACAMSASAAEALTLLGGMADAPGTPPALGIDDLPGYGEAGAWARRLADELSAYRDGRLEWRDVDGGVLLSGPPGTGKTSLVRSLAAVVGVPLVSTSYTAWQQHGEGHLGDVLKGLRKAFTDARSRSPCILFIDELDALPARGLDERNSGWFWPIVTALLELLDGTENRAGVVVVAACNHAERIDPAILRPGRLNRRVEVGMPTAPDLARILSAKLEGAVPSRALLPVATALAGRTTGADTVAIAREVRRRARLEDRATTLADVEAVAMPPDARSHQERRVVATHEAGHAIAALHQGVIPSSISIQCSSGVEGIVVYPRIDRAVQTRATFEADLVRVLAGRAAEEIVLGEASAGSGGSAGSDLATATRTATVMAGLVGFEGLVYDPAPDVRQIEAILDRAYSSARTLMIRRKDALESLADLLLDRRTLDGEDLRAFATAAGLTAARSVADPDPPAEPEVPSTSVEEPASARAGSASSHQTTSAPTPEAGRNLARSR